jgi:hypothetical protein
MLKDILAAVTIGLLVLGVAFVMNSFWPKPACEPTPQQRIDATFKCLHIARHNGGECD